MGVRTQTVMVHLMKTSAGRTVLYGPSVTALMCGQMILHNGPIKILTDSETTLLEPHQMRVRQLLAPPLLIGMAASIQTVTLILIQMLSGQPSMEQTVTPLILCDGLIQTVMVLQTKLTTPVQPLKEHPASTELDVPTPMVTAIRTHLRIGRLSTVLTPSKPTQPNGRTKMVTDLETTQLEP
jgi:hypothetical protein